MVESEIQAKMGAEKYERLENGLANYINKEKDKEAANKSQEIFEALEVLNSLSDFQVFKKIMLAKKSDLEGANASGL